MANRSLELIGKELGMFVDKSELKIPTFRDMTIEQIDQFLAEMGYTDPKQIEHEKPLFR